MRPKWVKVLGIVVAVIVVLLLIAFITVRVMLNRTLPDYSGTIHLDGLITEGTGQFCHMSFNL